MGPLPRLRRSYVPSFTLARPGCAYVACGGMALAKGALVIDVLLREVTTGRCLWGDTFTCRARPAETAVLR